ncbi:hypothetical protein Tco_0156437 [Tanacetum coccineum]
MHTRASNSELVEPLAEAERTLNRRLHRRNRRVPFEQRNEPPQQPKTVYIPILDIKYFCHFLDILQNYNPMDDEPMWAADRVVSPTPSPTITIPKTTNEFAIKGNIIKIFYHSLNETNPEVLNSAAGGIFFYKTPNQAYQLLEDNVLLKLDREKNQKSKPSLKKTVTFAVEGPSNFDTNKIMARMDTMTIKMDAQYKDFQTRSKPPTSDLNDDDLPMSREEEEKFMQTFFKQKQLNLGVGTERMIFNIDSAIKHYYSNDDTCFSIDVIDEILEEDALLNEGSKILHSIEGTILEEELFAEFDKFIAMAANENF